jgi:hypothetical protein
MSQILNSSIKLNEDQILTVINNLAKCRHLTKVEQIFKGKPSFKEETIKKLEELKEVKKMNFEYSKVTKLVDVYIFKLSIVEENDSVRELRIYNPNVKIKNLNERVEFVFVIDTDRFDKQHYLSLIALYPLIHDYVDFNNVNVSITCSNLITTAIAKHFNSMFLPCPYRVFSLCDVYPLIGSKSGLYGFTSDFELIEYEELYNKCDYMIIYDNDPMVKILNAQENDLIICKNILFETTAYFEYTIRIVKRVLIDTDSIDTSGLVY